MGKRVDVLDMVDGYNIPSYLLEPGEVEATQIFLIRRTSDLYVVSPLS